MAPLEVPEQDDVLDQRRRSGSSMFLLGDWINYGEKAYGEKYAQALSVTSLSYDTLRVAHWVAEKFETDRRRSVLEYWVPEQDDVLDQRRRSGSFPSSRGNRDKRMPRQQMFVATGIGLVVNGNPTYKQWAAYGRKLGCLVKWSMFLLGDWLEWGEEKFKEKHAQAYELTGLSYSTLANAGWVAREFTFSRRREILEWWPHLEVAALEAPEQDKILDDVETFVREHPVHDHPKRSEVRDWVRLLKRQTVLDSFAEMQGKYRVVYADPPWQYNDSGASAEGSFGKAEDHYPTMATEAIAELPIEAHTRPNSVLFMWITAPMLMEASEVLEGWGFTYKTHIVWNKKAHVVGNYVSCRHELLLIATRGSCTPDELTPMVESVQTIERGRRAHSSKPEEFRTIVDGKWRRSRCRSRTTSSTSVDAPGPACFSWGTGSTMGRRPTARNTPRPLGVACGVSGCRASRSCSNAAKPMR